MTERIALITGAAHRIGRAMAHDLAIHGWDIVIHYHHSESHAQALAQEIQTLGQRAFLVHADLAIEEEVWDIFPQALRQAPKVSLLINNASFFQYDSIQTATRTSWDNHLAPNLRAPFILSQAFTRQTEYGSIINILDQRVQNLTPHYVSYTVAKSGLWALTQSLALACAPKIRVNGIAPGPVLKSANQTEAHFQEQCQNTPLETGGFLEDICSAVRFLSCAQSVTGQLIFVDGGQHLGWSFPTNTTDSKKVFHASSKK